MPIINGRLLIHCRNATMKAEWNWVWGITKSTYHAKRVLTVLWWKDEQKEMPGSSSAPAIMDAPSAYPQWWNSICCSADCSCRFSDRLWSTTIHLGSFSCLWKFALWAKTCGSVISDHAVIFVGSVSSVDDFHKLVVWNMVPDLSTTLQHEKPSRARCKLLYLKSVSAQDLLPGFYAEIYT